MDYKQAYLALFNGITDLIEDLKELQRQVEEIAICDDADEKE